MNNESKSLMFGPPMSLNAKATSNTKVDMNAMTDLVRALKDVDVSQEKITQNKHNGTGTATGKDIKLSNGKPHTERG